jgi:hypothetical protein
MITYNSLQDLSSGRIHAYAINSVLSASTASAKLEPPCEKAASIMLPFLMEKMASPGLHQLHKGKRYKNAYQSPELTM